MSLRAWLFAAVVAVVGSGAPAALAQPAADALTVKALRADPRAFDGASVRVRGQVDNCVSMTCHLCPEEMTPQSLDRTQCLGLSFDGYDGADELMEQAFRFATVTLDAAFDPACLQPGPRQTSDPEIEAIVICTDRATVLSSARVVAVHERRPSTQGLVTDYDLAALVPAGRRDARDMFAALRRAGFPDFDADREAVALVANPSVGEGEPTGKVCVCKEATCRGAWPTRWIGGFDTPANPFWCYDLARSATQGWRVEI